MTLIMHNKHLILITWSQWNFIGEIFLSEKDPLPWSARVQIALDSARGLEYIHEHTVPVYIHRDIKSANILMDKNFRAKVIESFYII